MEPNKCYFCGNPVIINQLESDDHYIAFCQICFASGPEAQTEQRALIAWNAAKIPLPN